MFELECDDVVKELWHGVCREIVITRLPKLNKVLFCTVRLYMSSLFFICTTVTLVLHVLLKVCTVYTCVKYVLLRCNVPLATCR